MLVQAMHLIESCLDQWRTWNESWGKSGLFKFIIFYFKYRL